MSPGFPGKPERPAEVVEAHFPARVEAGERVAEILSEHCCRTLIALRDTVVNRSLTFL
jgi:hypothetical protein